MLTIGINVLMIKFEGNKGCYLQILFQSDLIFAYYIVYFDLIFVDLCQFRKAPQGSPRKVAAQKQVLEAMSHRMHIDESIKLVGKLLFGMKKGPEVLASVRPAGQPVVDDWDCLKSLVPFLLIHHSVEIVLLMPNEYD